VEIKIDAAKQCNSPDGFLDREITAALWIGLPVAQALLPVRTLQKPHSQEWLCY
jgi:hypothetical protein